MGKRGRSQKKENRNIKRRTRDEDIASEDVDDEIDTFIKQRDVIPLDMDDDNAESDEDDEQPVFALEGIDNDDTDGDNDEDDFSNESGLAAKIVRQQKFLRAKFGGAEDEMHEDDDEEHDKEQRNAIWGPKKNRYYNADNRDYELQSSDDESLAEEEEAVLQLQRQKAQAMSLEDFGLDDTNQEVTNRELTLEEMQVKKSNSLIKEALDNMDANTTYEKIEKDLNSLTRDEQMDILYSSAPELVGLLSELNDSLGELESKIHPLLSKVKNCDRMMEGGFRYLEMKQLILLSYCQAITFYLLLKSEGQPIRDHPVIGRLVEIKSLLDKMKQLDENFPTDIKEILNKIEGVEAHVKLTGESVPDSLNRDYKQLVVSADTLEEALTLLQTHEKAQLGNGDAYQDKRSKPLQQKKQDDQVGVQNIEMLKVRTALEEKLKKNGIFSSMDPKLIKAEKHLNNVNGQLETYEDFDDETSGFNKGAITKGLSNVGISNKVSRLGISNLNKTKVVSGDDDLPERDDIGERRRKYELQGLARATIKSDENAMEEDDEAGVSEDEFYRQIKEQRAVKLATKAEIYTRTSAVPPQTETVDGKRNITYQMEKNRGLTRARKKLTKNPRKKYKLKYKDAENRRKGQVREIKKPMHLYGGEASGINTGISRSVRFKN